MTETDVQELRKMLREELRPTRQAEGTINRSTKVTLGLAASAFVAVIAGLGSAYTFVSGLPDKYVTKEVFNLRMDSVTRDLSDVKHQTREIPRLSAQFESMREELRRLREGEDGSE